jgi:hypothetical protein
MPRMMRMTDAMAGQGTPSAAARSSGFVKRYWTCTGGGRPGRSRKGRGRVRVQGRRGLRAAGRRVRVRQGSSRQEGVWQGALACGRALAVLGEARRRVPEDSRNGDESRDTRTRDQGPATSALEGRPVSSVSRRRRPGTGRVEDRSGLGQRKGKEERTGGDAGASRDDRDRVTRETTVTASRGRRP